MPQDEEWSWKKLFKGPVVGKNYAKALILMICQLVILAVIASIVFSVLTLRGCKTQSSTTNLHDNQGTLNQVDNHASTAVTHYHFPLSDIFSFGSKGKTIKPEKDALSA